MKKVHVLPVADLKPHESSELCECAPMVEVVPGGQVIIHNSFDGREILERAIDLITEN